MRKMRAIHREKGLCVHCALPVEAGYTVCSAHKQYFSDRNHRPEYKAKVKADYQAKKRKRVMSRVFGNEEVTA